MQNNISEENNAPQSFRSPPIRRRSSFFDRRDSPLLTARQRSSVFERRLSLQTSPTFGNVDLKAKQPITDKDSVTDEKEKEIQQHIEYTRPKYERKDKKLTKTQEENFLRYYKILLKEKEDWKNQVKTNVHKYHDLKQQLKKASSSSRPIKLSFSALSNEDIQFCDGKPTIRKIIENAIKLQESALKTMNMAKSYEEFENLYLKLCEQKINAAKEFIFDNSTIEQSNDNE